MIHVRYAVSTIVILGTALAMTLAGCSGGAAAPAPTPADQGPADDAGGSTGKRPTGGTGTGVTDGGGSPTQPSGASDVDGGPRVSGDGSSCANVDGAWKGTVEGSIMSLGTTAPAKGTVTLNVVPGSGGASSLGDGSIFDVTVDSPLGPVPFKQSLTGTVECGVLKASLTANVAGTDITGTATCTFNSAGCKGTWQGASTDKSATGSGTFNVAR